MGVIVGGARGFIPGGGDAGVGVEAGGGDPPPTGGATFPRLGAMVIGGHNYDDPTYRAQIAKFDLAIVGMYNGWNGGTAATSVAAIKALNPNILLGNYTIVTEMPNSANPAQEDIRTKLSTESGPGGVGDWWAYDSAGNHLNWSAGTYPVWDTNLTLLTTPDAGGDRFPQWLAKRDNDLIIDGKGFDIWFLDNCFWRPRSNADWDRNGSNDSASNESVRNQWRDGQRAHYDAVAALQPGMKMVVNADSDLDGSVWPSEATPFEQFKNVLHGAYLERIIGKDWSAETWGGWSGMMGWYHNTFNNLVGGVEDGIIHFDAFIGDFPNDYKAFRYAFGACLMNNGYFSASFEYDVVPKWYDEYDLTGTATSKWLGTAVDPPQAVAWSQGVYRRRFEHGMALVNPKGNGQQTVTVGAGYHRFSGTQDPVTNDGTAVTSTVTLADRDGLFLVKD